MHLVVYIHDTSAWFGRFVFIYTRASFFYYSQWLFVSLSRDLSGPIKINVLFLPFCIHRFEVGLFQLLSFR